MYHRVCADADWRPSPFVVSASVFRAQLRWLVAHGFYAPRLSDVLRAGGRAPRGPGRPVLITFDDGYADNLDHAVPALRALGLAAAMFPVLDPRRRENFWDTAPELRGPLLSVAGLREVEAAGVELGSHTVTHPHLTALGRAARRDELVRSRDLLGEIAARPLPVLAYPYGDVDDEVKRAARDAGYRAALAVDSGPLELSADLLEIRRQRVGCSADPGYLALLLSGIEKLYRWSRWRVRTGVRSAIGPKRVDDAALGARAGEEERWPTRS
jgi:peptidoglycan/xylan/chitin deacetylase (PgdA/CDA1 family)